MVTESKTTWRAWLVLARASNLPTVWSNCLAAGLLGGGLEPGRLVVVGIAASLLYTGGMVLNDAFDAEFDRRFRRERPSRRASSRKRGSGRSDGPSWRWDSWVWRSRGSCRR